MATGSSTRILRAPGRLVVNPTELDLEFPHGGIEVGHTRLVALSSLGTGLRVESEGLGGEPTDILESDNRWVLACFVRGWDDDAVRRFFPARYVDGETSGHAVLRVPGVTTTGQSVLATAPSLLYVPDDPIRTPSVLAYRAVPSWTDGAEMQFQRGEELGLPVAFECVRGATGKILEVGMLADLSLT